MTQTCFPLTTETPKQTRDEVEMLIHFVKILQPLGFGLVSWHDTHESLHLTLRPEYEAQVATRMKRCIDHCLAQHLTLEEAQYIASVLIGSAYHVSEHLKPAKHILCVPDLLDALLPQGLNDFNALLDTGS